jgi:hypothetical protein
MGPKLALVFLHAGGLSTLIHHLKVGGSVASDGASDADTMSSAIPDAAAMVLGMVLQQDHDTVLAELQSVPGVSTTLTGVFRDARLETRCTAAAALQMLATAQPIECEGMVDGGVVELVLKYSFDLGAMPGNRKRMGHAVDLACVLLRTVPVVAHHFERAIRAPDPVQAFAALALVQVCPSCCIDLVHGIITPPWLAPFQHFDQEVHVKPGIGTPCPGVCAVLSAICETGFGYSPCLHNLLMGWLVHQDP